MRYKYLEIKNRDRDLCFFDLETTGLSSYAEIIEIGALRVESDAFNVMEEFEIKIKPQRIEQADPEALKINGYDPVVWNEEGIELKEGLSRFIDFAEGSILVAQNLPMDWTWLQRSLEDVGLDATYVYAGLDTISLAWGKFQREGVKSKLSLTSLANYFGMERENAHRALGDAKLTYQVFLKLIEENGGK